MLRGVLQGRAPKPPAISAIWELGGVHLRNSCLKDYESVPELIEGLRAYFAFYNDDRPHHSFGILTPAEVHHGADSMKKAA